jgi:hypothetical protein
MVNLLEALLSSGKLKRQDGTHLTIQRRPLPTSPRQLMELFGAMGVAATFQGLIRGLDIKGATAHQITYIVLGRWPTSAEIATFADPYETKPHLFGLLRSDEFRANFVHRMCEAFPERHRLLFVQIPRSAGQTVIATMDGRHPLLPNGFTDSRFRNPAALAETLGRVFSRLAASNALAIAQPQLSAFLDVPDTKALGPDPLAWRISAAPCRLTDLLFAIMRDPESRALGQVNALLAACHAGEAGIPATIKARLDPAARRPRLADWRQFGSDILAETILRNPICHALGDGTADGAMQACARSPLHLVAIEQFKAWARSALDATPPDPAAPTEPCIRKDSLTRTERDIIDGATSQDRMFYARFAARLKATELPAVLAREI